MVWSLDRAIDHCVPRMTLYMFCSGTPRRRMVSRITANRLSRPMLYNPPDGKRRQ